MSNINDQIPVGLQIQMVSWRDMENQIAKLTAENLRLRDENAELCGYDSWEEKERERQRAILGGGDE